MSLALFVSLVVLVLSLSDAALIDFFDPRLADLSGCWRMDDATQGLRFELNLGSFPSHIVFNSFFPVNGSRPEVDLVYVVGNVTISQKGDLRLQLFTRFRPWPVGAFWRFATWNSTHMIGGEEDEMGRPSSQRLNFRRSAQFLFCKPWLQPALPGVPLREESVSLVSMLSGCWRADEPTYASEHDFGQFPSPFIVTTYTNLATNRPEASLPPFELWAVMNVTFEDVGPQKRLQILLWTEGEFALAVFSTWNSTNMMGTFKRTLMTDPVPLHFERKPRLACGGAQLQTTRTTTTTTTAGVTVTNTTTKTTSSSTTIATKERTTTSPLSLPSSTAAAPADVALIGGVAGGVAAALLLGAGIAGFLVWRRKGRASKIEASTSTTTSSASPSPYAQIPAMSDPDRARATPDYGHGRMDL
jgi:hypothetical protein